MQSLQEQRDDAVGDKTPVKGEFEACSMAGASGWIDLTDLGAPGDGLTLWVDGHPCLTKTCNDLWPDLQADGIDRGRRRFLLALPQTVFDDLVHSFEVRTAQDSHVLPGGPKHLLCPTRPQGLATVQERAVFGSLDVCDLDGATGWAAFASGDLAPVIVELVIDGVVRASEAAQVYRVDLADAGYAGGRHGFSLALPDDLHDGLEHSIEVRSAHDQCVLQGGPKRLRCPLRRPAPKIAEVREVLGSLDSCDALGIHGWAAIAAEDNEVVQVELVVDGVVRESKSADVMRADLADFGYGQGRHGFVFALPEEIFDGQPHSLAVFAQGAAQAFNGSPILLKGDPCDQFTLTDPDDLVQRQRHVMAALAQIEALSDAALGPREQRVLSQIHDWLQDKPFAGSRARAQTQIERVAVARCQLALDGLVAPDVIGGGVSDAWGEHSVLAIELLQDGKPVVQGATDAKGRFALTLPDALLDDAVHTLALRVPACAATLGPWHFLLNRPPRVRDAKAVAAKPAPTRLELARLTAADLLADPTGAGQTHAFDAQIELADALMEAGHWSDARQAYKQALALDPEDLRALRGEIHALAQAGDDLAALALARQAVERLPKDGSLCALADQIAGRRRVHDARVIAFYLPQFHPVAENNEWWGEGFTEWANVGAAKPLFDGHMQPRRPTALGYYDLRLPETANAQFDLARRYGIDGFCYYYYWFEGRRILEKPLQDLVDGRTGPFPFSVCWANEDWTRSWDGASGEVLLAQNHSEESDFRFIQDLGPLLRHPDYIRVDGRPMVLIYRADRLAAPKRTVERWRQWCRDEGIGELHLCAVQSFGFDDPRPLGFDAAVEFPPHCLWERYSKPGYLHELPALPGTVEGFHGKIYDWQAYARAAMARPREAYTLHRTSMAAWDNTARRQNSAHVYQGFSVDTFEHWVEHNVRSAALEQGGGVSFINAWNEWAEGTVLEPDAHHGYEILEATHRARERVRISPQPTFWSCGVPITHEARVQSREHVVLVGHDAFPAGAQTNLLNMGRCLRRQLNTEVSFLLIGDGVLLPDYERVAPTYVIGNAAGWREALAPRLAALAARGVRKALCNTVLTGDVADLLKAYGFRIVGLIHEMPGIISAGSMHAQCWRMADKADALVCASRQVALAFEHQYWPEASKMLIAPQGIVLNQHVATRAKARELIRERLSLPKDSLIVMGCGYGDTRKGIDLFVQLAGKVTRHMSAPVAFLWVGDLGEAQAPQVRADIERMDLGDRLQITGRTTEAALYFAASDLFALTSREDPFPSVVMEAFDAKMPVLGFDGAGGFVDIVNADTGALLPYLDVEAMAQAAEALLADAPRRQAIGEHNHRLCRERFAYAPYMRKLLALLAGVPAEQVAAGHLKRQPWFGPGAKPTISVIVPNFNYAEYLELRLRTVLAQTLAPDEIIVLDDGSSDGSLDIVHAMAAVSPIPMRLLTSERNSGNPFVQWARGLAEAKGDLVWIAEADDYCEPTLLETLAGEFTDDKVVMAWSDSVMVDHTGKGSGAQYKSYYARNFGEKWYSHFRMPGRALIDDCLFTENVVPNASAVLFRRSAVDFDLAPVQHYRFSGDWWFWLFLARNGDVVYRADPLNYHRRHGKSVMGDVLRSGQKLLPETMGFYSRLAAAAPDCVNAKTASQALARMDQLYGMFAPLQQQSPNLAGHPEFADAYAALAGTLRRAQPAVEQVEQGLAALVLSADALAEDESAQGLVFHLAAQHAALRVVVVGAPVDPTWTPGIKLPQDVQIDTVPWASRAGTHGQDGAAERLAVLVEALDALLGNTTPVYSHGLLAHCVMVRVNRTSQMRWALVAGNDFNALLGRKLAQPGADVESLALALRECSQVGYLGRSPPHAMARLAQPSMRVLERLPTLEVVSDTRQIERQTADAPTRCLYGIATDASIQDWKRLAQVVNHVSRARGVEIDFRLLTWGESVTDDSGQPEEFSRIYTAAPTSATAPLVPLGDVAVRWATSRDDHSQSHSPWLGVRDVLSIDADFAEGWERDVAVRLETALQRDFQALNRVRD